jgi:hypothetical protein
MADRSQVTKITLAYLKDPKNMPKDNTPKPEGLDTDLEDLELPEEEMESDEFKPGSDEMLKNRPGGNPGRNPRSKNDLFKKKKEAY